MEATPSYIEVVFLKRFYIFHLTAKNTQRKIAIDKAVGLM